jgi:hypothetical protein
VQRFRGTAARRRCWRGVAHWTATRSARCRSKPPIRRSMCCQRLADVPDPGLPSLGAQRLLPVGRRLRLPRPVAGRDGAGPRETRIWCANICCCARAVSSRKATCSTGGIRRRAAACARAARTTTCGCRWRCAATCTATADTGVLDEPVRSSKAAGQCRRGLLLRSARPLGAEAASSTSTACAPSARPALRRARPAADRLGRLERRHEPGRRSHGKGESVWLGFFLYDVLMQFASWRAARRRGVRRALRAKRAAARRGSNSGLGRRVVPSRLLRRRHAARFGQNANARSIPSRRAGRCCPARALRRARAGHGGGGRAPGAARRCLIQLLDPPFDKSARPRLHQGLRAGRARERRTVHPCGDLGGDGLCRPGRRARAWELLRMINPVNHAQSPGDRNPTRSSPTSWRQMSMRWRRTPAAAAGPGTPARPAGCTG